MGCFVRTNLKSLLIEGRGDGILTRQGHGSEKERSVACKWHE